VNTADYWTVFFNLNKCLKLACDKAGISISFPQRTLHNESGEVKQAISDTGRSLNQAAASNR
jgi:small-conductance mechanosensitive channel